MSIPLAPWLQPSFSQWKSFVAQKKIPHALLLYGVRGLGKARLARQMLQNIFCETQQLCGACRHCHWLQQGAHPDCLWIQPEEGKAIKIDAIREASEWLQLSPLQGAYKILVIESAHTLNRAASNALLKTLEEPPPSALIFLLSENLEQLLPTVRSRCHKMPLFAPDEKTTKAWIYQEMPELAYEALMPGIGPYALLEESQEKTLEQREKIFDLLEEVAKRKLFYIVGAEKLKEYLPSDVLRYIYGWLYQKIHRPEVLQDNARLRHWLKIETEVIKIKRSLVQGANLNWPLQVELLLESLQKHA